MLPEVDLGDIVRLRKKHPCGSFDWEVIRVGLDIGCGMGKFTIPLASQAYQIDGLDISPYLLRELENQIFLFFLHNNIFKSGSSFF